MTLTLGLLALFAGGLLVAITVPKMIVGRMGTTQHPHGNIRLFIAGLVSLVAAIPLIHWGQKSGVGGSVPLGITLFFVGLLLILLGIWLGLWAPLSLRNTNNMLLLILLGVGLIAGGILVMAGAGPDFTTSSTNSRIRSTDWDDIFSHRFGPFPFGWLCLGLAIFTNALILRNGLSLRRAIGVNGLLLAMLTFLYMIGPSISRVW